MTTDPTDTPDLQAGFETIPVPEILPVVPLRDMVLFPYTILPLAIGREASLKALEEAFSTNSLVLLLTQRDANLEQPVPEDLFAVGCVGQVMRTVKLPDGHVSALVQGLGRVKVDYFSQNEPFLQARVSPLVEPALNKVPPALEAIVRSISEGLEKVASLGKPVPPEILLIASGLKDPLRMADLVTANLGLKIEESQQVLETLDSDDRLKLVHRLVEREIALLEMQQEMATRVRGEMDHTQREYFLRQQLRTIQKELGDIDDLEKEVADLRQQADEKTIPEDARTQIDKQLRRLQAMHPDSAESSVVRTWLDWIIGLPWAVASEDRLELDRARAVLDEDHFGLDRVKDRIMEILAVRKLKPDGRSPILCFVGPPGVGKTSLGRSISRALGRRFVRHSLGGVRDEAEIRGHRRTYVGALPGRIIQGISQAGTSNPVFMLDEVDKLGADVRGDPSSALLEVLDPEQNNTYRDHYLGVDFDLSNVLFIATANVTDTIQPAFLDRMEVITLSGYTDEEKRAIAERHLVARSLENTGLGDAEMRFQRAALDLLIHGHTREAGVRQLQQKIEAVCRKVAVAVASDRPGVRRITPATVERLLGPQLFESEEASRRPRVGVATGLAYTSYGGDVLLVEALALPGKGNLKLTGSLGDVMKESASAALSRARAHASELGLDAKWFDRHDVHLHIPEGAVPKDGPSAGVTLLTAILSVASNRKVRHDLAMTGEITLRGEVLPVGGVKEKVLAALRAGITDIVLPKRNAKDLRTVPKSVKKRARFILVEEAADVIDRALLQSD